MGIAKKNIACTKMVKANRTAKPLRCLACGETLKRPRRRYCSDECRQKIHWVLSLSKGLLKAFSTRYAAFSFTERYVILDVLPAWSDGISRFICERQEGNKPAEDLKNLVLQSGKEWHAIINNRKSKSYASLCLLDKTHDTKIDPNSIKPDKKIVPKLTARENSCLKVLELKRETLCAEGHTVKITAAYRKKAKLYHPDMGGDAEKFKELNEAHKMMLSWAENPIYKKARRSLQNCWSYDASTNRWTPPL